MRICFNDAHPLLAGQQTKVIAALTDADGRIQDESLYFCLLSAAPLGPTNVVQGRGTVAKGKGKGKGSSPTVGRTL